MNNGTTMNGADAIHTLGVAGYEVPTAMTTLVNSTVDAVTDGTADMGTLRKVLHAAIRAVGAVNPDGCCTVTITRRDGDMGTRCVYTFKHWECPSFNIVEISTAIAEFIDDPSGEPDTAAYFNHIR